MSQQLEQIKDILLNACKDFKNDIILLINDDNLKMKLEDAFNEISHIKILLFVYLIKSDNMHAQILEFCDKYNIEKNDYNINIMKKHYNYFLEIKNCLI